MPPSETIRFIKHVVFYYRLAFFSHRPKLVYPTLDRQLPSYLLLLTMLSLDSTWLIHFGYFTNYHKQESTTFQSLKRQKIISLNKVISMDF
jgi:hypothetical protein